MNNVFLPLGEMLDFFNGKAPTTTDKGKYTVFGSNGPIGRSESFNHENAIILGRVGAYCGSVEWCPRRFWASDNTIVAKTKNNHDLRYMYYRLLSSPLRSFASGAAQPLLTHSILRAVKIKVVMELRIQRRIASVLSAHDDLIENNRRRIQLLEQAARMSYKEWFVRLRFPGHEHVKVRDGVPQGWEWKSLGEIAATNAESYKAGELPYRISYTDISAVEEGRIVAKNMMASAEAPGRARRKAKAGDTIWSNVRPNLRAYALVFDTEENDVFSTGFTVLSPIAVPFTYLHLLVTTDEFVGHLANHATGVSYPAVRPDDFERAIVLVPSACVLRLFQDRIEPIYRLVHVLEKEMASLSQARDLLLTRLMSGD